MNGFPPPTRGHAAPRAQAAGGEAGFTIVEVIVAALILAIVASAAATGFVGSIDASETLRNRSTAQSLARQNEARLRGYDVNTLSNLTKTLSPVRIDGTQYTVTESARYITDGASNGSCTNPSTDYLQTTSSVSWTGMRTQSPVTSTSLLTPSIGSTNANSGSLVVTAYSSGTIGVPGLNVTATSGTTTLTGTTNSAGCVLLGDIPAGTYTVSLSPATGTYVDGNTAAAFSAGSPDTQSATVSAAATSPASASFQVAQAGSLAVSFTDRFPSPVAPSPTPTGAAAGVVLYNNGLNSPSGVVCTAADNPCPAVGPKDASFPAADFAGGFTATGVFPYTYSAWAGTCLADNPTIFNDTAASGTVASGATGSVNVGEASIVLRAMQTATSETTISASSSGWQFYLYDNTCGTKYVGYTGAAPALTSGQAALQMDTSTGQTNSSNVALSTDDGLLTSPGMPDGNYSVCVRYPVGNGTYLYDHSVHVGSQSAAATTSFTNSGNGEIVYLNPGDVSSQGGPCT